MNFARFVGRKKLIKIKNMGRYLAIGLVIEQTISKKNYSEEDFTKQNLISELEKRFYFKSNLYDLEEYENEYKFTIKQELIESELIPFLNVFYKEITKNDSYSDYEEVINILEDKNDDWLEIAKEKSHQNYQIDTYGDPDILRLKFGRKIYIDYKTILLSMEGKILMEDYGRLFNFFKYCIENTYKEFAISGAIRVYITG